MKIAQAAHSWHRQIIPFTLALRVLTFTTPSSLAAAAELPVIIPPAQEHNAFSQEDFLALTNAARIQNGLRPLVLNQPLENAAFAKAEDMAAKGYWDHFRPSDHKAPWDFIHEAGYTYKVAGENLARGFVTPNGITKAWMASPTHRANVLSPYYTEVGFASVRTTDSTGKTVLLTVQMFGSR